MSHCGLGRGPESPLSSKVWRCTCSSVLTNQRVAAELGIRPQTVGKWRNRFLARRLEGLVGEQRPGAPRKITDEQVGTEVSRGWR
ncbi:helix-turn-helix domain-containing protein [Nonomuraea typhae]|uniref:Helix-turn-helix domain-containing protein n=1 Tax=Nonomuraea typhae TaxID=2603600 RepID=A0ABW7Z0Y7_9ACTN